MLNEKTKVFREKLLELEREELLDIIRDQNPEYVKQINRIEYVFANKLKHLTWSDGTPIDGRQLSKEELALLIDEPFVFDQDLSDMGLTIAQQRELHVAKDVVTWSKAFLDVEPRVYQALILRHPSLRKVLRAGRRLGKTVSMSLLLLHYSYTNKNAKSIVIAPMKAQVEVIYKEVLKFASNSEIVKQSITRSVTSPQFVIEFSNGSQISFFTSGMRSGGKCLTPDHDVLTESGWKSIAEVKVGEVVASYSEGDLVWRKVSHAWEYDYIGDMIKHSGKQLSFCVTPNHKFLAKTKFKESKYRFIEAEDLKDYKLPAAGNPTDPLTNAYSGDELELWGWWLAEGSGFIGKMARFSQFKKQGRDRLVYLANKLGLHYTCPAREIRIEWRPPLDCGQNAYNKFIPRDLLSEENRQRLMDGLLGGDGYIRRKGWEYSSSSWALINDVQELAIRIGLRANLREKDVSNRSINRHWVVSAYPRKTVMTHPDLMETIKYDGKIHCITVEETGVFLTRHNGLIHVTGNSDVVRGQEAHLIVLDELDYMHPDDLIAVMAMLQKTSENQPDKILIGASTPTGKREIFYAWCTDIDNTGIFKEFWFPSYCNPMMTNETEKELRLQYTSEMAYRHEVEADWGEDAEGVYPRRFIDAAFTEPGWNYNAQREEQKAKYVFGVDWDKYGAGVNIVILEVNERASKAEYSGRVRLAYREETLREEYTLTKAVERIIQLNEIFIPEHIYVDRGFGEVQIELLHKHGADNRLSGLATKVKGISSAENIEIRDPFTQQKIKKEIKPFMVDNLRQMLEKNQLIFPTQDTELYKQLSAYVVARKTASGRPVYEASGTAQDHAHDALMLACHAINENYGELMKSRVSTKVIPIGNDAFLPTFTLSGNTSERESEEEFIEDKWGDKGSAPVMFRRSMSYSGRRSNKNFRRKSF